MRARSHAPVAHLPSRRPPPTPRAAWQVMPVLAACFVADGFNVVLSGVLRGAGRHWIGATLNLLGW